MSTINKPRWPDGTPKSTGNAFSWWEGGRSVFAAAPKKPGARPDMDQPPHAGTIVHRLDSGKVVGRSLV
ncbi:MAG: hypothetical protein V4669_13860 [Pseudomonadota bacterium]